MRKQRAIELNDSPRVTNEAIAFAYAQPSDKLRCAGGPLTITITIQVFLWLTVRTWISAYIRREYSDANGSPRNTLYANILHWTRVRAVCLMHTELGVRSNRDIARAL